MEFNNPKKIGKMIACYRILCGFTQEQLAEKLRLVGTTQTISNWERGQNMPSIQSLLELCELLQITPNDLLLTEEHPASIAAASKLIGVSPIAVQKLSKIKRYKKSGKNFEAALNGIDYLIRYCSVESLAEVKEFAEKCENRKYDIPARNGDAAMLGLRLLEDLMYDNGEALRSWAEKHMVMEAGKDYIDANKISEEEED